MKTLRQIIKDIRKMNPNLSRDEVKRLAAEEHQKQKIEQKKADPPKSKFRQPILEGANTGDDKDKKNYEAHTKAVNNFLRTGIKASEYNTTDNTVLIPDNIEAEIQREIAKIDPIRERAYIKKIKNGNSYKFRRKTAKAAAARVKEGDVRNQTDVGSFEMAQIDVHQLYAYPKTTLEVLEDGDYNLEEDLKQDIVESMGEMEKEDHVKGDGVNKAKGLLVEDYGFIETEEAGIISYDDVINLEYELPEDYIEDAEYFGNKEIMKYLRKLKDKDGQYIFKEAAGKEPALLNGYPFVRCEDFPRDIATGAKVLGFGYINQAYVIVDKDIPIDIKRDDITEPGFVKFHTRKRSGGGARFYQAFKFLKVK